MAADCHTHRRLSADCRALVSVPPESVTDAPLTSLEFHPWAVPADFSELPAVYSAAAVHAAALGETGLDRRRGPEFSLQLRAFEAVLALADSLGKPVVIHCVGAWDELLAARRRHPRNHWLIHGFRGKPELLAMLLAHGFFISLSPAVFHNRATTDFLRQHGLEHIGFETDDCNTPFASVLAAAAEALELPPETLAAHSELTLNQFLRGHDDEL